TGVIDSTVAGVVAAAGAVAASGAASGSAAGPASGSGAAGAMSVARAGLTAAVGVASTVGAGAAVVAGELGELGGDCGGAGCVVVVDGAGAHPAGAAAGVDPSTWHGSGSPSAETAAA